MLKIKAITKRIFMDKCSRSHSCIRTQDEMTLLLFDDDEKTCVTNVINFI
jgi:hypothetical protein